MKYFIGVLGMMSSRVHSSLGELKYFFSTETRPALFFLKAHEYYLLGILL